MKLKLKTSGKIIICVFLLVLFLVFHLVYKSILLGSYNSNYKKVNSIYKNGEVLDKVKLTKVRASTYMFLSDDVKISIEYDDLEKDGSKYKFKTPDGYSFTLEFKEEDNKELAKTYMEMFDKYESIMNSKLNLLTSISKIRKQNNILKRILKNVPVFDKANSIDGKIFDGYTYQKDNKYTYILYGNSKKITLIFKGKNLDYEYLTYLIATLNVE